MTRTARLLGLVVTATLSVWASSAHAQSTTDSPTERARQLYNAGAAAYGVGQYAAAVQALSEAYALEQRPTILFSLAQAERHLYTDKHDVGALRDAVGHYRRYLTLVPQGGRRVDAIEALTALDPELLRTAEASPVVGSPQKARTRIMVWTATKDAVITIDGAEHQESTVVDEVSPGPHVVRTKAPGYFPDQRTITGVDGNLVSAEVVLREQPARLALEAPPGTEVSLDGRPLGEAPIGALDIPGGPHLLGLSRLGHVAELRKIVTERGHVLKITGKLPLTKQRQVAIGTVLGAGVAAVAGGAFLGVTLAKDGDAKQKHEDAVGHGFSSPADLTAYDDALDARRTWKTATTAAFGASAGLLVIGAALYFLDHPRPDAAAPRVGTGPSGIVLKF
jgi:tetratricopeptide (TPR) repeat protein